MNHDNFRPIPPGVMTAVADSWRRIDAWLAKNAPTLAGRMGPGATPEAIARAESALGVEFPDAVRASYLIHDGSEVIRLFPPGGFYMSLDEMTEKALMMRQGLDEGNFEGLDFDPKGPIRRAYCHPSWIPLTDASGNFTFIDLDPGEGGVVGQLVNFGRETGPEDVAAAGLAEYLAYLADGLDAGAATVGEDSYLEWNQGDAPSRSGYVIPPQAE